MQDIGCDHQYVAWDTAWPGAEFFDSVLFTAIERSSVLILCRDGSIPLLLLAAWTFVVLSAFGNNVFKVFTRCAGDIDTLTGRDFSSSLPKSKR